MLSLNSSDNIANLIHKIEVYLLNPIKQFQFEITKRFLPEYINTKRIKSLHDINNRLLRIIEAIEVVPVESKMYKEIKKAHFLITKAYDKEKNKAAYNSIESYKLILDQILANSFKAEKIARKSLYNNSVPETNLGAASKKLSVKNVGNSLHAS